MARLTALDLPSSPEAWRDLGFTVVDDTVVLGGVAIRVGGDPAGLTGWGFDVDVPDELDGLATRQADGPGDAPAHANGITAVDHVVVGTGDVGRTLAALGELGLESRRQRIGPLRGSTVHQEFVVAGTCVIELVGPPEPDGGAASFWGLALVAADLDATAEVMGRDRLREPHDAVQPGRRITTVVGGRTAVGTPLAVLSPRPTGA